MKKRSKYRILEINDNGRIHYIVQCRRWFLFLFTYWGKGKTGFTGYYEWCTDWEHIEFPTKEEAEVALNNELAKFYTKTVVG